MAAHVAALSGGDAAKVKGALELIHAQLADDADAKVALAQAPPPHA
jgi:hypothetical protein